MLKANLEQVVQSLNYDVITLRSLEITYYSNFFLNFATQSTLILGALVGTFTQTPVLLATCNPFWLYMYGITTSVTFVYCVQAMMSSLFITVYAQGLAIRGSLFLRLLDLLFIVFNQQCRSSRIYGHRSRRNGR